MVNNAKKSQNLYEEMRARPVWWFSPARDDASSTQLSEKSQVRTQEDEVSEVLEGVPPKKPAPKDRDPTRPTLSPDLTSPDLAPPGEADQSGFTQAARAHFRAG